MHPSPSQMREPAGDHFDEPNADADAVVHVRLVLKSRLEYYLLATTYHIQPVPLLSLHTDPHLSCHAWLGKLRWDL